MSDIELKRGRPTLYPQGRKTVSLSLPVDVAEKLKQLGGSRWVQAAIRSSTATTDGVSITLTKDEFSELQARGGISFLKDMLTRSSTSSNRPSEQNTKPVSNSYS